MNVVFIIVIVVLVGAMIWGLLSWYCSKDRVTLRRLRRAPLRAIDSFPDGQSGRIVGRLVYASEPLIAPLSNRPCAYYHVMVEEYQSSGETGYWKKVIDSEQGRDYILEDETGKALVRMNDARIAVHKDEHYRSGTFNDATPNLERFLNEHGDRSTGFLGLNKSLRYEEGALEEGEEVTVLGVGHWIDNPQKDLDGAVLVFCGSYDNPLFVSDDEKTVGGAFNPLRRMRKRRGQCVNCGYDLRGHSSRGCPECGWRR